MNLDETIQHIEDHLVKKLSLDPWERVLYYHLLRHTHVLGKQKAVFSIATVAKSSGLSESKVRDSFRSLNRKGCLRIENRSGKGHVIHVLLPVEVDGVVPVLQPEQHVDIESIDFYKDRRYISALLKREANLCFYCLREVSADSCHHDHVKPQVDAADNSYRNIVVACHDCNATKQGKAGDDFVRALYRAHVLSRSDLDDRLKALQSLQAGELVPNVMS